MPLPRAYRPRWARLAAVGAGATLVVALAVLWLLLPDDSREGFTLGQRVTLVVLFGGLLVGLYALFRTAAIADVAGLTVVNGFVSHHFEWAELVRVSMTTHRPWALLDLADGSAVAVMAIQAADGKRANRAVRDLATLLAEQTRTPDR